MPRRSQNPPPAWFILTVLGIGGLVLWWNLVQKRRSEASLRALAQRLGFECVDGESADPVAGPPQTVPRGGVSILAVVRRKATGLLVTGRQSGRTVEFFTFTTGVGRSRVHWRGVAVIPRQAGGLQFHFQPQGFSTKLKELVGSREIEVGDAAFDKAWFLETNEADFIGAALGSELRVKLMAAHAAAKAGGNFKLELGAVRYAEHGSYADPDDAARFEQMLPLLHELADLAEVAAESGRA